MAARCRRGMVVPLVLVALVALATLGRFIATSGTGEYGATVASAHRWQADAFNHAVLEEALAVLYDRCNRPFDADPADDATAGRNRPAWHDELFAAVRTAIAAGNVGPPADTCEGRPLSAVDLTPFLVRSRDLVTDAGGTLVACTARFEGFRPIFFTPDGRFVTSDDPYYRNTDFPDLERLKNDRPLHYQGFVVVTVTSTSGAGRQRVSRTLETSYDLKVTNAAPMARQFAVWQSQRTTSAPDVYYEGQQNDLNEGGGLKVYPEGARVLVAGPYEVDTHGWPNGTGNTNRAADTGHPGCDSYLPELPGQADGGQWHGWSLIPSLRAGVVQRSLFFGAPPPARPAATEGTMLLPMVSSLLDTLTFGAWMAYAVDPGFAIVYKPLDYYCASRTRDLQKRSFSLVGAPSESVGFSGGDLAESFFSGVLFRCDGQAFVQKPHDVFVTPGTYPVLENVDPKETVVVVPEVNIWSRVNRVRYEYNDVENVFDALAQLVGIYAQYSVGPVQTPATVPYGLYFMQRIEEPMVSAIGRWLLNTAMFAATVVVGGAMGGAWGFGETVQRILVGIAVAGLAGSIMTLFRPDVSAAPGGGGGTLPSQCLPSNHCPDPFRLVTRFYEDLNEIPTFRTPPPGADGRYLHLDGTIMVRGLDEPDWFRYCGKGNLVVMPPAAGQPAVLKGPIVKSTRDVVVGDLVSAVNDHLNIMCCGSDGTPEFLARGDERLVIRPADGLGGSGDAVEVDASVLSPSGVQPDGCSVWIVGNLICSFFNKRHIPADDTLRVLYNRAFRDYVVRTDDPSWSTISLSFRPAGWCERGGR